MKKQFEVLFELIKEPLNPEGGIKTDHSIRFIYPPDKELDFREYLLDTFIPRVKVPDAILTAIQWQFYDSPTKAAIMSMDLS